MNKGQNLTMMERRFLNESTFRVHSRLSKRDMKVFKNRDAN